jgi:hypothetical protein
MLEVATNANGLMSIEAVQKALNRSRASVYRYANTDPKVLNLKHDPQKLNPEYRKHKDEPLLFHPNEVARFARDILGVQPVTIEVKQPTETLTQELLRAILVELQGIHGLLASNSLGSSSPESDSPDPDSLDTGLPERDSLRFGDRD